MRVILDTNFVISLAKFKVEMNEIEDLIGKHQLFTLDLVLRELRRISGKNSRLALKLIEAKKVRILSAKEKNVDEAMISLANKNTIIATNDARLRKKLKNLGIKTIYLRSKKHFAIG